MTPSPATVRRMEAVDYPEVVAVTARAFWNDPFFDFFSRDLLHQHRLLPAFFQVELKDLRRPGGEMWVADHDEHPRAFAGWLSPGAYPRPAVRDAIRTARAGAVLVRARHRRKALRLLLEVDRHHPHEPHWYLALLATDPTAQGRGLGSALLEPVLERCDEAGVPAYLETQKEANVSWYARAGFSVSQEVRLPGTPTVWCLRREPAGA